MSAATSIPSSATWSTSAVKMVREQEMEQGRDQAEDAAEERMLDALLPPPRTSSWEDDAEPARQRVRHPPEVPQEAARGRAGRQGDRDRASAPRQLGVEIMAPPGMEEMTSQLQGMFQNIGGGRTRTRKLRIRDALEAAARRRGGQAGQRGRPQAARAGDGRAERHRLHRRDRQGRHARRAPAAPTSPARACSATCCRWSRAAPSSTKYGMVKTDHILFIASGAFHLAKPSDLIPELQGRLPIRVELGRAERRRLRRAS